MLRRRNRVPAGHTAPLDSGERDIPNQAGFDLREGIPVYQCMDLTYLSLLPRKGPENGKKKMKTKYNFSSCKAETRGKKPHLIFCRNIRQ